MVGGNVTDLTGDPTATTLSTLNSATGTISSQVVGIVGEG